MKGDFDASSGLRLKGELLSGNTEATKEFNSINLSWRRLWSQPDQIYNAHNSGLY